MDWEKARQIALSVIRKHTLSKEDAEDLASEVMIEAMERGAKSAKFVRECAKLRLIDRARKKGGGRGLAQTPFPVSYSCGWLNPNAEEEKNDDVLEAKLYLLSLPMRDRMIVHMHSLGYSSYEIADVAGMTPGATRLRRVRLWRKYAETRQEA